MTAALAVALASATLSCTADDDPDTGAADETSTPATNSDGLPEPITEPLRGGELTLELGDRRYQADIRTCTLTNTAADILGFGTHDDKPFRIEHGPSTGGQVILYLNTEELLDPGDAVWAGPVDLDIAGDTAKDSKFTMTRREPRTTEEASLEFTCDPETTG
jgi:hypothetical protein